MRARVVRQAFIQEVALHDKHWPDLAALAVAEENFKDYDIAAHRGKGISPLRSKVVVMAKLPSLPVLYFIPGGQSTIISYVGAMTGSPSDGPFIR